MDYKEKYEKYKSKYLTKKAEIDIQKGGVKKDTKKTLKKDKKDKKENKDKDAKFIFKTHCVEVLRDNKGEEEKFHGTICRTPGLKIRFKTEDVKLPFLVKSLLRIVNKGLRMKYVKEVKLIKGKKETKIKGDKLNDEKVDLSLEYEKVLILM